jgi:hypothetical protein
VIGKNEAVFVFPSTHHMLRAEAVLKEKGFNPRLVPAPQLAGELCTTAIALPANIAEEAVGLLKKGGVLVKTVLSLEEPATVTRPSPPPWAAYHSLLDALPSGVREALSGKRNLERGDLVLLLEPGMAVEHLCRSAEALAGSLTGREAVPAVLLEVSSCPGSAARDRSHHALGRVTDPASLSRLASEMKALGLVYLVLMLGEPGRFPWGPEEHAEALGPDLVTVVYSRRLPENAAGLVREYGVRQVLLRRKELFLMSLDELADEILFLRDNRPGPLGSGNLLPLESRSLGNEEDEKTFLRVLAVLRLALSGTFLPVPEPLWEKGILCGGNMVLLELGDKTLSEALEKAEKAIARAGWSLRRTVTPPGSPAITSVKRRSQE